MGAFTRVVTFRKVFGISCGTSDSWCTCEGCLFSSWSSACNLQYLPLVCCLCSGVDSSNQGVLRLRFREWSSCSKETSWNLQSCTAKRSGSGYQILCRAPDHAWGSSLPSQGCSRGWASLRCHCRKLLSVTSTVQRQVVAFVSSCFWV